MRVIFYGSLAVAIFTASPRPRPARPQCSVELSEIEANLPDLDGDGRADYALRQDCGATGNCRNLLIVTHGARCPQLVGEYFGQLPRALDLAHRGLRDLSAFNSGGCAGRQGGLVHLVFNGQNYTAAESVNCLCGDEPDAGQRDPRCDTRQFP